ncbi:TPA: IS3 family transposase, partial [Klebsiella pneumoniae]|nr:IS3 family transposase [Klebsiella pneumoniae]
PEKANIGGERNCHSFRGLCRGGSWSGSDRQAIEIPNHELKIAIEDYIRYYNTRRISLKFNGLSPVEYRLKSYPGRN